MGSGTGTAMTDYCLIRNLGRLYHVGSLRTASTFHDLELHILALNKGLEAFILDSGEVYEHIVPILTSDEAITFFSAEPLNFAYH